MRRSPPGTPPRPPDRRDARRFRAIAVHVAVDDDGSGCSAPGSVASARHRHPQDRPLPAAVRHNTAGSSSGGERYHKVRPCPAGCKRHARACPPPCAEDCTNHARWCPRRRGGGLVEVDVKSRTGRRGIVLPAQLTALLEEHRAAAQAQEHSIPSGAVASRGQEAGWKAGANESAIYSRTTALSTDSSSSTRAARPPFD